MSDAGGLPPALEDDISWARRWLPDGAGAPALNRITALAARLLGVGYSQVSLLTEVQTVAAGSGLPVGSIGSCGPLEDSLCTVTATAAAPLLVSDAVVDDRVRHLPPVVSGMVGAYLGVPLTSSSGAVVGALCVFDARAHTWSADDVLTLELLAESVQAELELVALGREYVATRARFDLAVQSGDLGSFDWDLVTGRLDWDERLIAIYGYDSGIEEFNQDIESVNRRLHPDDAQLVADAIDEAIASVGPLQVAYRIVVPERGVRWLEARGRAVAGSDGTAARLLGVTWDVTDQRAAEARAEQVLSSMTVGFLAMDDQWRITYVNAEGKRLLGPGPSQLVGGVLWDLFPGTRGTVFEHIYRRVADTRVAETFEAYYPAPLNTWFEIRVLPSAAGITLYFLDINARHESQELLQLSVDVAEHLVGDVSAEAAIAALARMVVPRLADWTIVSLADPNGRVRDVQNWHVDPAKRPLIDRYTATRLDGRDPGALTEVVRTAKPDVITEAVVERGLTGTESEDMKAVLAKLRVASAAVLPIVSGGGVTGVLTLCRDAGRAPLTEEELAVAISLCRWTGVAFENARLAAAQAADAEHDRTVAQSLQQALLTDLPEPDHLQMTARYWPATDRDQVGGDWYDAVVGLDGATTVMIGDVVGHDITAAAVMGQLRTMLRMLALDNDQPLSEMMQRLDQAARQLDLRTMASVVAARIEQTESDRKQGLRTLRWANAGHPPPIVLMPDGQTHVLESEPADILIGVVSDAVRHEQTYQLAPDTTLFLYTDGLVETRTHDLDHGISRLRNALADNHTAPFEILINRVLEAMIGDQQNDDVALLAVRLNAEK